MGQINAALILASNYHSMIEEHWSKYDEDQNGYLDKDKCKKFLQDIDLSKIIGESNADAFNEEEFNLMFSNWDKENTGTI